MHAIERLDVDRNGGQRRVGCKHDAIRTEEIEPAGQAVGAAEHCRVAVELLEIIEMRALQRGEHLGVVLVAGAATQHGEAGTDAAVVVGDEAAAVVRNDLDFRMPVEQAVEHQSAHGDRGFVGPAEADRKSTRLNYSH